MIDNFIYWVVDVFSLPTPTDEQVWLIGYSILCATVYTPVGVILYAFILWSQRRAERTKTSRYLAKARETSLWNSHNMKQIAGIIDPALKAFCEAVYRRDGQTHTGGFWGLRDGAVRLYIRRQTDGGYVGRCLLIPYGDFDKGGAVESVMARVAASEDVSDSLYAAEGV